MRNNDDTTISAGHGGGSATGVLQKLHSAFETTLLSAKAKLEHSCDKARSQLTSISQDEIIAIDVESESACLYENGALLIENAKEAYNRIKTAKEGFRIRHGLLRDPKEPNVLLNVLIFGIYIFGDALLNSTFLQNAGMVATPAAALLVSAMFSFVIVLASASAGFFCGRRFNHGLKATDPQTFSLTRLGGRLGFLGFVALEGFILLSLGLIRSQRELDWVDHSISSYIDLIHQPEAVMLMATGLAFSAISYYKGMSAFSDPYLGYGELGRAYQDALDNLIDTREDLIEETQDVFDEAAAQSERQYKSFAKSINAVNGAISKCQTQFRNFSKNVAGAESQLKSEVTHSLTLFQAAGGQEPGSDFDLDEFCSFQHMLDIEIPESLKPPATSPDLSALFEAKEKSLKRLAALFSDISDDHSRR